jgi:hypothetical protein
VTTKNKLIINATGIDYLGGKRVLDVFKKFKIGKIYYNINKKNYGLFSSYLYKIYLDFGSIPYRIKNAYEHRENPIVIAINIASNLPRRMAEFVTETTIIG